MPVIYKDGMKNKKKQEEESPDVLKSEIPQEFMKILHHIVRYNPKTGKHDNPIPPLDKVAKGQE